MLDQRRAEERGYITLKEAAKIANYTPDYVGQLIRAGKIKGEQVYSQVAWVTTEEEVQAYLADKSRTVEKNASTTIENMRTSYMQYVAVACMAVLILLFQYVFYVSLNTTMQQAYSEQNRTVTMNAS